MSQSEFQFSCIMLVDDDEVNNYCTIRLINKCRLAKKIITHTDGQDAIEYLRNCVKDKSLIVPDLILLDVNMPRMDGFEFLEEYKSSEFNFIKKPNVVVLSTSIREEDQKQAQKYTDVISYLEKPFSLELAEGIIKKINKPTVVSA